VFFSFDCCFFAGVESIVVLLIVGTTASTQQFLLRSWSTMATMHPVYSCMRDMGFLQFLVAFSLLIVAFLLLLILLLLLLCFLL
jgi:uncharacterized membrane protein